MKYFYLFKIFLSLGLLSGGWAFGQSGLAAGIDVLNRNEQNVRVWILADRNGRLLASNFLLKQGERLLIYEPVSPKDGSDGVRAAYRGPDASVGQAEAMRLFLTVSPEPSGNVAVRTESEPVFVSPAPGNPQPGVYDQIAYFPLSQKTRLYVDFEKRTAAESARIMDALARSGKLADFFEGKDAKDDGLVVAGLMADGRVVEVLSAPLEAKRPFQIRNKAGTLALNIDEDAQTHLREYRLSYRPADAPAADMFTCREDARYADRTHVIESFEVPHMAEGRQKACAFVCILRKNEGGKHPLETNAEAAPL